MSGIKMRLSLALCFNLYWHPSSSLSRLIVLYQEPTMCSRGCACRYSSSGALVILSALTLWSLTRKEGGGVGARRPAAIVSHGILMGWSNSQPETCICLLIHGDSSVTSMTGFWDHLTQFSTLWWLMVWIDHQNDPHMCLDQVKFLLFKLKRHGINKLKCSARVPVFLFIQTFFS